MGCNTSQELKTKDGTLAAVNGDDGDCNTTNNHNKSSLDNGEQKQHDEQQKGGGIPQLAPPNHAKTNATCTGNKHLKDAVESSSSSMSPKQNGILYSLNGTDYGGIEQQRHCDKAEISELNDMELGEDEDRADMDYRTPYHHHHHGSNKKIRRNPLRNLDLDFKFDVNSF